MAQIAAMTSTASTSLRIHGLNLMQTAVQSHRALVIDTLQSFMDVVFIYLEVTMDTIASMTFTGMIFSRRLGNSWTLRIQIMGQALATRTQVSSMRTICTSLEAMTAITGTIFTNTTSKRTCGTRFAKTACGLKVGIELQPLYSITKCTCSAVMMAPDSSTTFTTLTSRQRPGS